MTFEEWYGSDEQYDTFRKCRDSIEYYTAIWNAATAAERARCAKIAADHYAHTFADFFSEDIVELIRKGTP